MTPSDSPSDRTLAEQPTEQMQPTAEPRHSRSLIDSYALGEVIGRGGMGEVVLGHDREIGRDVAIKRLNAAEPSAEALDRFMREARIQARLDHPAIVPVYEIGYDRDGKPYFTMKRLAGVTLAEVLHAGSLPRQRLLRAFADVCLAVEFAHARGIVHRDLKPANIMLGDYGEVYVLDWGLARAIDGEVELASSVASHDELATQAGAILGTPGYMAPEQIRSATEVGCPADVYSLGAILFEVVAGEPLHRRGDALESTLAGVDGSPARRRPEHAIAPELDLLCSSALSQEATARPSAAELAEGVQRYLDGDRDVERRKKLAAEHVAIAQTAIAARQRAEAMRAAGRALALDPEVAAAAELVTTLMLEPPSPPPPELAAALRESDATMMKEHARQSGSAFLAIAALAPIVIWNGVLSWTTLFVIAGITLVLAVGAFRIARNPERSVLGLVPYLVGVCALLAALERMCSPFVFVPAVATFAVLSLTSMPVLVGRARIVVGLVIAGWAIPLVLEELGVLASTWSVRDGALWVTSHAIRLEGGSTITLAILLTLATIVIGGRHGSRRASAHHADRRQLVSQAWHLRQLLPASKR